MAYGSDAEDEGLGAGDMDPGTAGGDTEQDEATSQQYSTFEAGFNAASALNNTTAAGNKTAGAMGGKKSTLSGVDTFEPAGKGYSAPRGPIAWGPMQGPLSGAVTGTRAINQQQALSQKAATTVGNMQASQQQGDPTAATPQDADNIFGDIFGMKSPHAADRDRFGEFNQAGFAANINNIENPTAARKGLPADMAFSIAGNPFSRWSSTEEKIGAAISHVVPFGGVFSTLNALGLMSDKGLQPGLPTQDIEAEPGGPTRPRQQRLNPRVTARKTKFADSSGSGGGGATRSQTRGWRRQGRTGGGY